MSNYGDIDVKSSSKFLKIESGVPHQVRLLGDAFEKNIHGFGKDQVTCGGEGCIQCADGSEPKQRFKANVYDHTLGRVMIFEFGASVGKQIREIAKTLAQDQTDITNVDLKISVSGTGMQKKYMVMPWMPPKALPTGLILHKLSDDDGGF
jgi:hypothetical protein